MTHTIIPQSKHIVNHRALAAKGTTHTVTMRTPHLFEVVSGTSGERYTVVTEGDSFGCSCLWATRGGYVWAHDRASACSHVLAVVERIESDTDRRASTWSTMAEAQRQRRPTTDIGDGVVVTSRKTARQATAAKSKAEREAEETAAFLADMAYYDELEADHDDTVASLLVGMHPA